MENFFAFMSYVVISSFTPGPVNIISMSNSSKYGFKKSIPFSAGATTAFFVIFSLCGFFSASLFHLIPSIESIMVYIGAAYILWLAYSIYTSKPKNDSQDHRKTTSYIPGFLFQFVNPKGIIYAITTVATFVTPYYKSGPIVFVFAATLSAIIFIANSSWALFGTVFQKFLAEHSKLTNTIMALLLVYCAISLFI